MRTKPACEKLYPWLRSNLGKRCLGVLTGTDARALAAAVHIVELYSYCGEQSVAQAFGAVVLQMQPQARYLAYHSIAMIMNWEDRPTLWIAANLPEINPGQCSFEPGGPRLDLAKEAA